MPWIAAFETVTVLALDENFHGENFHGFLQRLSAVKAFMVSYKDVRTFFQIPVLVLQRFEGGMLLDLGSVLFRRLPEKFAVSFLALVLLKKGESSSAKIKILSLWILFLSHYVKVPAL